MTDEFLVHTVYGCQVVVTNPTSSRQRLTVLVQLPVGAIPVANGQFTKSIPLDLEPYRTAHARLLLLLPEGRHSSRNSRSTSARTRSIVAAAVADHLQRRRHADEARHDDWDYISQNGTNEEVLAFLNRENVRALNLDKIAFRLKDRGFFEAVTKLLQDRHLYHPTTWSYGLLHADLPTAREFLAARRRLRRRSAADRSTARCSSSIR